MHMVRAPSEPFCTQICGLLSMMWGLTCAGLVRCMPDCVARIAADMAAGRKCWHTADVWVKLAWGFVAAYRRLSVGQTCVLQQTFHFLITQGWPCALCEP